MDARQRRAMASVLRVREAVSTMVGDIEALNASRSTGAGPEVRGTEWATKDAKVLEAKLLVASKQYQRALLRYIRQFE